jgi:threonine/homoserine/homoserine lactone efflux protein
VPGLDVLASFALASLALLLVPGPAVVYIVNRSVADGRHVALASVGGLTVGNFVHAALASIGVSAALAASSVAFSTIKWLGVAYLIGVGIRTLVTTPSTLSPSLTTTLTKKAFVQGLVVNVLNPKVALFFLSFLPQFVSNESAGVTFQTFILGGIFVGIGFVTDSLYALMASGLRETLLDGRVLPFVRRWFSGSVFVTLGILAALR